MRASKYPYIDAHFDWLQDQLVQLTSAVENTEYYQDFGTIEWPINKHRTLPSDIEGTSNFLTKLFSNSLTYCGLNGIEERLKKEKDIDYFFLSMHLLGHQLIYIINPVVKDSNMYDVAFIEVTCLFFAAIVCKKYYNINSLSLEMVKEISMALYDTGVLEQELDIKNKWTGEDYLIECMRMLELLHDEEIKSYN